MNFRIAAAAIAALALSALVASEGVADTMWSTHGDGSRIGTISTVLGTGTDVGGGVVGQQWAAAFDTDGKLYTLYNGWSGNAQLAIVDQVTGGISSTIGGVGTSMICLEVDAGGQMYGVGYNDRNLYRIDKATGATTLVGDTGLFSMMDLAFDAGGTLWATVNNNLYTLDLGTGAATLETALQGTSYVMGIAFDSVGTLFATDYVSNSDLFRVDTGTGATVVVGNTGFYRPHGGDIFVDNQAVPEPGTLGLLGLATVGLAVVRRRRRLS